MAPSGKFALFLFLFGDLLLATTALIGSGICWQVAVAVVLVEQQLAALVALALAAAGLQMSYCSNNHRIIVVVIFLIVVGVAAARLLQLCLSHRKELGCLLSARARVRRLAVRAFSGSSFTFQ